MHFEKQKFNATKVNSAQVAEGFKARISKMFAVLGNLKILLMSDINRKKLRLSYEYS
jgi:hypothetical protein